MRWLVVAALLRSAAGLLCSEYGQLRTTTALLINAGPLCLDTSGHTAGPAFVARCDPRRATQWWAALSPAAGDEGFAVLVQATQAAKGRSTGPVAHERVCLNVAAGVTQPCPKPSECSLLGPGAACKGFVLRLDESRRLRLFDGRCSSALPGSSRWRLRASECAGALAFELPSCKPLPPLLDTLSNVALGAHAVMSSAQVPAVGDVDASAVADGFVESHGCAICKL
jgi:hypothetical protein